MRKFLIPLAAAAVAVSTFGAYAADTVTNGTIKAVDMKAMTLTLEDGTVYSLPKDYKDPGLKAGEKVAISWQMANSKHQADKIEVVK